jgi:hypothetical protein
LTEVKREWVHLVLANISVGAKHDLREYEIITNNLYAVMLLQASKTRCTQREEGRQESNLPESSGLGGILNLIILA